jgi:hypothetical protein
MILSHMPSRYSFIAFSVSLSNSSSVFSSFSFFLGDILSLLHLSILLIISCVIHVFLALLSALQAKFLIVSNPNFLIWFHGISTFSLSQSIVQSFSSTISRNSCHLAHNFSKPNPGFHFRNIIVFVKILT